MRKASAGLSQSNSLPHNLLRPVGVAGSDGVGEVGAALESCGSADPWGPRGTVGSPESVRSPFVKCLRSGGRAGYKGGGVIRIQGEAFSSSQRSAVVRSELGIRAAGGKGGDAGPTGGVPAAFPTGRPADRGGFSWLHPAGVVADRFLCAESNAGVRQLRRGWAANIPSPYRCATRFPLPGVRVPVWT